LLDLAAWRLVLVDPAHEGGEDLAGHHRQDDRDDDGQHEVVVEALEGGEQGGADATATDEADQGGIAQVRVELVGGKADEARQHLRHHAHDNDREEG
jgi:hypothetical protein